MESPWGLQLRGTPIGPAPRNRPSLHGWRFVRRIPGGQPGTSQPASKRAPLPRTRPLGEYGAEGSSTRSWLLRPTAADAPSIHSPGSATEGLRSPRRSATWHPGIEARAARTLTPPGVSVGRAAGVTVGAVPTGTRYRHTDGRASAPPTASSCSPVAGVATSWWGSMALRSPRPTPASSVRSTACVGTTVCVVTTGWP